jgi:hypothetical protein
MLQARMQPFQCHVASMRKRHLALDLRACWQVPRLTDRAPATHKVVLSRDLARRAVFDLVESSYYKLFKMICQHQYGFCACTPP